MNIPTMNQTNDLAAHAHAERERHECDTQIVKRIARGFLGHVYDIRQNRVEDIAVQNFSDDNILICRSEIIYAGKICYTEEGAKNSLDLHLSQQLNGNIPYVSLAVGATIEHNATEKTQGHSFFCAVTCLKVDQCRFNMVPDRLLVLPDPLDKKMVRSGTISVGYRIVLELLSQQRTISRHNNAALGMQAAALLFNAEMNLGYVQDNLAERLFYQINIKDISTYGTYIVPELTVLKQIRGTQNIQDFSESLERIRVDFQNSCSRLENRRSEINQRSDLEPLRVPLPVDYQPLGDLGAGVEAEMERDRTELNLPQYGNADYFTQQEILVNHGRAELWKTFNTVYEVFRNNQSTSGRPYALILGCTENEINVRDNCIRVPRLRSNRANLVEVAPIVTKLYNPTQIHFFLTPNDIRDPTTIIRELELFVRHPLYNQSSITFSMNNPGRDAKARFEIQAEIANLERLSNRPFFGRFSVSSWLFSETQTEAEYIAVSQQKSALELIRDRFISEGLTSQPLPNDTLNDSQLSYFNDLLQSTLREFEKIEQKINEVNQRITVNKQQLRSVERIHNLLWNHETTGIVLGEANAIGVAIEEEAIQFSGRLAVIKNDYKQNDTNIETCTREIRGLEISDEDTPLIRSADREIKSRDFWQMDVFGRETEKTYTYTFDCKKFPATETFYSVKRCSFNQNGGKGEFLCTKEAFMAMNEKKVQYKPRWWNHPKDCNASITITIPEREHPDTLSKINAKRVTIRILKNDNIRLENENKSIDDMLSDLRSRSMPLLRERGSVIQNTLRGNIQERNDLQFKFSLLQPFINQLNEIQPYVN